MTRSLLSMLVLVGCGAGEPAGEPFPRPAEAAEAPGPTATETPGPTATETLAEPEDERARIIREAEEFVRAQGYTDTPPTVSGDDIVHEGIEGTMDDRRGMLSPRAVRAMGGEGTWTVLFAYRSAEYAGRGRALVIRDGQRPSFVHQDAVLSAWGASEP